MREDERPQFVKLMTWLQNLYPQATITPATQDAYFEELKDLPWSAVRTAGLEASKASPDWFPTAGQLRMLAIPHANRLRETKAQAELDHMLPAPGGAALNAFYGACDTALQRELGDEVNNDNGHILTGILIALGSVYGLDRVVMQGKDNAEKPEHRTSYTAPMVWWWKRRSEDPRKIINGLRRIPALFQRYPTAMMIEETIRGTNSKGWPERWLRKEKSDG